MNKEIVKKVKVAVLISVVLGALFFSFSVGQSYPQSPVNPPSATETNITTDSITIPGWLDVEQINASWIKTPMASESTYIVAASNSVNKEHANWVCDGTDDQVEIQAAVDSSTDGRIILTDGTFRLSDNVVLAGVNIIAIEGMGWCTVIESSISGDGRGVFSTGPNPSTSAKITIKDLLVDGNMAGITGITIYNTTCVNIEHVKVIDVDSSVSDTGYGIYINTCDNVWIKDCVVDNIEQRDGIQFKGVYNGHIEGCNVTNVHSYYAIDLHSSGRDGENNWVINNHIEDCHRGINIEDNHTHCCNNHIEDIALDGIELRADCNYIWICDNDIIDIKGTGINGYYLDSADNTTNRFFFICDNYLNQTIDGDADKDGIFWDGHYSQLSGNIIEGFTRYGIYVRGDENSIHGNIIFDCATDISVSGTNNMQADNT